MSGGFTEWDAEEAALGWLESLGYTVKHGPDIAFGVDGGERSDPEYHDTILQNRLHRALTGWFAGPKADRVASLTEDDLIEMGLTSLAAIFSVSADHLRTDLVASRAINWGNDPFARGAYSYATPQTPKAQSALRKQDGGPLYFSGEALYAGPDMGTVEAALAAGRETARAILAPARQGSLQQERDR